MRVWFLWCGVIIEALILCSVCSGMSISPAEGNTPDLPQTVLVELTGTITAIEVSPPPAGAPAGPETSQKGAIIAGKVFSGAPGPDEIPLQGASLELFCSAVAASPGVTDGVVKTNSSGYYSFNVSDGCNFYTIVLYSEGEIVHAESDSGVVIGENRIQLTSPPTGAVAGDNNFWVASPTPGPTATVPGFPGLDILTGGLLVLVTGIIALFAVLLLQRRKGGDECG